jgi:hypothetical protein
MPYRAVLDPPVSEQFYWKRPPPLRGGSLGRYGTAPRHGIALAAHGFEGGNR